MGKPIVGSIVHFAGQASGKRKVCRAAIVTVIREDLIVSLCVFNPTVELFKQSVRFDENRSTGSWHWAEPAEGQDEPAVASI